MKKGAPAIRREWLDLPIFIKILSGERQAGQRAFLFDLSRLYSKLILSSSS